MEPDLPDQHRRTETHPASERCPVRHKVHRILG